MNFYYLLFVKLITIIQFYNLLYYYLIIDHLYPTLTNFHITNMKVRYPQCIPQR